LFGLGEKKGEGEGGKRCLPPLEWDSSHLNLGILTSNLSFPLSSLRVGRKERRKDLKISAYQALGISRKSHDHLAI